MLTEQQVIETLRSVKYPGYSRDIVSFGLVKQITVDGGAVTVLMELGSSNTQAAAQIKADSEQVLKSLPNVTQVNVEVRQPAGQGAPAGSDPWAKQARVKGIRRVVAIASGKGGVGKSTLSVNLACALNHLGARVGLLDSDIYGPTIPLMMGTREQPTLTDDHMIVPLEKHGVKLMSIGFLLEDDQPVIWRGPMIVKAIQQFLHGVQWGELDCLLVDLPPGTGDAQLTVCQTVPLDGGIIITTPQEASLGVVRKGIAMFEKVNVPILGLVENMSYLITPGGERLEIFGHGGGRAEAARRNIPFLGEVPIFTEIRVAGDNGVPVVVSAPNGPPAQAFIRIASELLRRLG